MRKEERIQSERGKCIPFYDCSLLQTMQITIRQTHVIYYIIQVFYYRPNYREEGIEPKFIKHEPLTIPILVIAKYTVYE